MSSEAVSGTSVREAQAADVPELTAIKGKGTEALHRDRLRDAQGTGFRYLVFLTDRELIGFACLVIRRPAYWSDADDIHHLPQIVDLQIKESQRGQGYGSHFIRAIEHMVSEAGYKYLYISVEPLSNPRAYTLYQRLGYQQVQLNPYRKTWEFQDSDGHLHLGENWIIDMRKQLHV